MTSKISKKSTTESSLFVPDAPPGYPGRRRARQAILTSTSWMPAPGRRHHSVAVADRGQRARSVHDSRCGERTGSPPVADATTSGGELVRRVQQADERAAHHLTVGVHHAAGDDRFLLQVDAGGQRQSLLRLQSTYQLPNSIGAPTREPYSVQLPS